MKVVAHSPQTGALWVLRGIIRGDCHGLVEGIKGKCLLVGVAEDWSFYERGGVPKGTPFRSLLEERFSDIDGLLEQITTWARDAPNVVLDGLHLLPALTGCSTSDLTAFVLRLEDAIDGELYVAFNIDVMGDCAGWVHLAQEWVLLEGLETGRAEDVTGVVSVGRGPNALNVKDTDGFGGLGGAAIKATPPRRTRYLLSKDSQVRIV